MVHLVYVPKAFGYFTKNNPKFPLKSEATAEDYPNHYELHQDCSNRTTRHAYYSKMKYIYN